MDCKSHVAMNHYMVILVSKNHIIPILKMRNTETEYESVKISMKFIECITQGRDFMQHKNYRVKELRL